MPAAFRTLILTVAFVAAWSAAAYAETARITFILVNDIYQMSEQTMADGKARGGFARLAAVVKAERAKGVPVIFAHAGDTLSPSLMSGLDRGAHIVALTNMMSPDIFVPGNHEFDFGQAVFLQRMGEARFPLFAANLRDREGRTLPGFTDRAIVTVGGVRVGLTGATYDETPRASSPGDLAFGPTVDAAREQAALLRREGADFVVAVVHADRPQDYRLLASRDIDLILTGHDHDLFINFDGRYAAVESSSDAHYVTVIDATIEVTERNGARAMKWWPQFRVIDTATVAPDPQVAAVVRSYEQELTRELDVPLATTAIELDSRNATVRAGEAAIGNVIADAMREAANVEIAVTNGGGIRAGKVYPAGSAITRRDVLAELPFNNRLVTIAISGRDLRRALENGLSRMPNPSGAFPQMSGLTVQADLSRPAGSRIASVAVNGAPLDEGATYRVAINDYLARGGDGYESFRDARRLLPVDDSPLLANAVMAYLRKVGTVRATPQNRLIFK